MISSKKVVYCFSVVVFALWWFGLCVGAGCSACVQRDEVRQLTKQNIKVDILRKLGLDAAPNVTVQSIKSSQGVRQLLHKMEMSSMAGMMSDEPAPDYHEDQFQPKQITILPSQPNSKLVREQSHWNTLYYKLSDSLYEEGGSLEAAHLLLHLPPAPAHSDTHARIRVYYVGIDKMTGKPTQYQAKEGTWELRMDRGGFVKINLINLVRKWFRNPSENFGIVLRAQTNQGSELDVPAWDSHMAPYLQLHFKPKPNHLRRKRNANMQCTEELDANVTQCCLWPLTIDFREFGWDWVLRPKTYEANLCSGDCSLGVVADSPHTHMLQMNLLSAAGPCCSARRMSPISIVYVTKDKAVVTGTLPGMKVEQCGCS